MPLPTVKHGVQLQPQLQLKLQPLSQGCKCNSATLFPGSLLFPSLGAGTGAGLSLLLQGRGRGGSLGTTLAQLAVVEGVLPYFIVLSTWREAILL